MSSSSLDSLVSIIPVIVAGGVAIKMTESMFGQPQRYQKRTTRRHRRLRRPPRRYSRSTGVGFGNFSNVGL